MRRIPSHLIRLSIVAAFLTTGSASLFARDFSVRALSETGNARQPSIGPDGTVAWVHYTTNSSASHPTDIIVWKNGETKNITSNDPRISGHSEDPLVADDGSVIFVSAFPASDTDGIPFQLVTPAKDERMKKMEEEYPGLFDPPTSAVESQMDASNAPPAEPTAEADEPIDAGDAGATVQGGGAWRSSGKGEDIVLYKEGQIQRITPGTRHFISPVASSNGLAFLCARGWPYGYEMMVWKTGAPALTQITTNYYYALNPFIHGDHLVYQAWDGNDYEIYRYSFSSGEILQITQNTFDDLSPVVWDNEVVWVAHPTVNAEIFHWKDGTIRKISSDSTDNANPSLWNGRAVWQGMDDTDLEIYYFDGRRTLKLTANAWDDITPVIRDGVVVWSSYVDNWDAEIMALDLSDNLAVRLTDNEYEDILPQTASEKIVWQTTRPLNSIIQYAEPSAPREMPVE